MSRLLRSRLMFVLAIAVIALVVRLMPHPANFVPIGAVAILGGMLLPRRYSAWIVVVTMMLSDFIIGLHPMIIWTWGSFALVALLSGKLLNGRRPNSARLVMSAMAGGTLFFVITNLGVWLQGGLYEKSLQGLVQCYVNALPFYRNTILGDVFFTGVFYAVFLILPKLFALPSATVRSLQKI